MDEFKHFEYKNSEEFNDLMRNDAGFRSEMLRRQAAAVEKIEAKRRALKKCLAKTIPDIDNSQLSPFLSDDDVLNGGGCSAHFIKTASVQSLQKAVKAKKLSLPRFRIEMKRRRRRGYYDNMPDKTYAYIEGR